MKQQKKEGTQQRKIVAQGVSRKIRRDLQDIIESLDNDVRHKGECIKQQYKKMCAQVTAIAEATNKCYSLWINDSLPLALSNNRSPLILLRYSRLFMEGLAELRQQEIRERKQRQKENQISISSYNSNNVYELIAKKNIQLIEMQGRINDLKIEREISQKKAVIAEQMTEAVRCQSEELLKAYRENFSKMTQLLKCAQGKQTQLLQSNRLLTEKIEAISRQYDNYKTNFKVRPPTGQGEKRLRQRLEREYQQRLKQQMRQYQIQMKNNTKIK